MIEVDVRYVSPLVAHDRRKLCGAGMLQLRPAVKKRQFGVEVQCLTLWANSSSIS